MCVPAARFWGDFDPAIGQSLSSDQRAEIERVLALDPALRPSSIGDLRISFRWFFIRIVWGREKRSADRLRQESARHPAITRKNTPALLTMGLFYTAFWFMVTIIGGALFTRYVLLG